MKNRGRTRILALLGVSGIIASSAANSAGLDLSQQKIDGIFKPGTYVEASFAALFPSIDGVDNLNVDTGNVIKNFGNYGALLKHDFSDRFSGAIIIDKPYFRDVSYDQGTFNNAVLGNVRGKIDSVAVNGIARIKFNETFSAHAGLRAQLLSANAGLPVTTPVAASYTMDTKAEWGVGFLAGAAVEIPQYAARASITYFSEIDYDISTQETLAVFGGGTTTVSSTTETKTPHAVNFEFQTGITPSTLLYGGVRWANWSEIDFIPTLYTTSIVPGAALVNLNEDTWRFELGVGQKLTEEVSVFARATYEDTLGLEATLLSPSNGSKSIGGGVIFTHDALTVTTGIDYIMYDDRTVASPTGATATFTDSSIFIVGSRVGIQLN